MESDLELQQIFQIAKIFSISYHNITHSCTYSVNTSRKILENCNI